MTIEAADVSAFFNEPEYTRETIHRYADIVHASSTALERFTNLLKEREGQRGGSAADPFKTGLGWSLAGRYAEALASLEKAPPSRERSYYAGEAAIGAGRFEDAINFFRDAARQGWDPIEADMRVAAVQLRAGQRDAAQKVHQKHAQAGQDRAEWHFVDGLLAEARDERLAAVAAYERCLTLDAGHTDAAFRCAWLYDLYGDDASALALYDKLAARPRAHVNALINASVIYEDIGRYAQAAECLRRVLRAFPNHLRARLFLKDVESCLEMVIDETRDEGVDVRARMLDTPLSEYELSVRARNCLKKMNIRTLGELIRLTEQELLAYKNFGETSLNEIKALLARKGLRLGQSPDEIDLGALEAAQDTGAPPLPPGQEAILAKSVSELELSVRARRCLQRLNVQTLGELVQYSEQDLLATRNFGVTSLNEVKSRLFEHGLQLAPKKAT